MNTNPIRAAISAAIIATLVASCSGCGKQPEPAKPATPNAAKPQAPNKEGHGATTPLGEQSAGAFTIKASRDGDITPGKDVPIDVWVTGTPKVSAVRFWIGVQDARGSIKAKAELETDNWHTHADVPNPLPAGSQLWVEVESDDAQKTLAAFDLRQ